MGTDGCWWGLGDERKIVRDGGRGIMSDEANINMDQDSV